MQRYGFLLRHTNFQKKTAIIAINSEKITNFAAEKILILVQNNKNNKLTDIKIGRSICERPIIVFVMFTDYSMTTVVQPCLSSISPYWMPRRVSNSFFDCGPGFSPNE